MVPNPVVTCTYVAVASAVLHTAFKIPQQRTFCWCHASGCQTPAGADADVEKQDGEEPDHDGMGTEVVPKGAGFDNFDHMLGSGSPGTRARRLELAGTHCSHHHHVEQSCKSFPRSVVYKQLNATVA